jgi:hypothetical protein
MMGKVTLLGIKSKFRGGVEVDDYECFGDI